MFCTKCGKQIPDSTKFCPYCGANCSPEQDIAGQAGQVFNKVEKELGSAFDEVSRVSMGTAITRIIIRVTMLIRITAMVIIMAQSHHTQVQD